MRSKAVVATYYRLTKPGIVYSNVITAVAGYLCGSRWQIDPILLAATAVGTALVIASGCVVNNVLDRRIDRLMKRTAERALVTGTVRATSALVYAVLLGLLGLTLLILWSRPIVVAIGLIAFVDYVVLYGYAKRTSVHSTLIGSISGAASLVAGYCAATNRFDIGALVLGLILIFWQMPHFFGIALYRRHDYAAANLPVLPVAKGVRRTKQATVAYILIFIIACAALTLTGYAGHSFLIIMLLVGFVWLWRTLVRRHDDTAAKWGRGVFLDSLSVNIILSLAIATATVLP